MSSSRLVRTFLLTLLLAASFDLASYSQQPAEPEMTTTDVPFTLKVERNEVPVRVVVRDAEGRPVQNLTKDDFQILDNGKAQLIAHFSTEGGAPAATPAPTSAEKPEAAPRAAAKIAERFVALYFDDLVMDFESIVHARDAAAKYLQSSLQPADRAAIVTSSGQGNLDFTADRDKLQAALGRLHPVGIFGKQGEDCPDLTDYEAYLIDDARDSSTLEIATQKVIQCKCGGNPNCPLATETAETAAKRRWEEARTQATYSLRGLRDLVRRLSILPGQRSIVFVSKGFFSQTQHSTISEIIDRAVRAGVVVNALDPRGLFVIMPGGDASQRGSGLTGALFGRLMAIQTSAVLADSDVLAEVTDGTGGIFFHNSNDFDGGFRAAGGLPEFSYVLVFSPGDLKPNGKYHQLKVSLVGEAKRPKLTVQARRGYFASVSIGGSAGKAEEEIADAVFSRDQLNGARLRLGTRFFMSAPKEARVTIVAHLETEGLKFRTENDHQLDDVTFVTVLFDADGNYVDGVRRVVNLRLRELTLEQLRAAGVSVASNFKVAPGAYLVREVVSDAGGIISSQNTSIEIPY